MSSAHPDHQDKWKRWLKKIGIAGFLFFLIKGLMWIAVFLGAWAWLEPKLRSIAPAFFD